MRKLSPLMRRAAGSEYLPEVNTWIDRELAGCQFKDVRLFQRFRKLLGQIASAVGQTIPFVCQDWANTKAAYRFFSNERVDEDAILSGHFQATRDRTAKIRGQVLILHDTTEFTYKRDKPHLVGFVGKAPTGKNRNKEKRENLYTVCGILMHSSLVVTVEGLPLGLSSIKFWTRKKFKGCDALKRKINPTRVPIEKKESVRWLENVKQSTTLLGEPEKCVHICDREGDIYELFCTGQEIGTHFLIRTCVDRLAGSGDHTVAEEMNDARVRGLHRIEVRDKKGDVSEATLEIKYRRVRVLPPIGKQNRYPALSLTIIHAEERGNPEDREKIDWKLITDLPVRSTHDVIRDRCRIRHDRASLRADLCARPRNHGVQAAAKQRPRALSVEGRVHRTVPVHRRELARALRPNRSPADFGRSAFSVGRDSPRQHRVGLLNFGRNLPDAYQRRMAGAAR
jgi:hypothetical protein